ADRPRQALTAESRCQLALGRRQKEEADVLPECLLQVGGQPAAADQEHAGALAERLPGRVVTEARGAGREEAAFRPVLKHRRGGDGALRLEARLAAARAEDEVPRVGLAHVLEHELLELVDPGPLVEVPELDGSLAAGLRLGERLLKGLERA